MGWFKKEKPSVVVDYEKECNRLETELDKLKSGSYLSINHVNLEFQLSFDFPLSSFLHDVGAEIITNSSRGISEKRWYFTEPYSRHSKCIWKCMRIVYTEETNSYKVVFRGDHDTEYESKEYDSYAALRDDICNFGRIVRLRKDLADMKEKKYKEENKRLEKKAWN